MNTPKGLHYIPNYLTDHEKEYILNFLKSKKTWKPVGTSKSSRKTLQFGYTYNYDQPSVTKTVSVPSFLLNIINADRINSMIGNELVSNSFDNLIINEYKSQGIAPHIDHVKLFGPIIVCISIGDERPVVFTNSKTGEVFQQMLEDKSLYIMSGESRYIWKHSLDSKKGYQLPRYSLTFRNVNKTMN